MFTSMPPNVSGFGSTVFFFFRMDGVALVALLGPGQATAALDGSSVCRARFLVSPHRCYLAHRRVCFVCLASVRSSLRQSIYDPFRPAYHTPFCPRVCLVLPLVPLPRPL